jgi:hypothetical protein
MLTTTYFRNGNQRKKHGAFLIVEIKIFCHKLKEYISEEEVWASSLRGID